MHQIFNYTLASHSATVVRLHRQYINGTSSSAHDLSSSTGGREPKPESQTFKSVDLYLSVPPGSSARFSVDATNATSPVINIVIPTSHRQPVASNLSNGSPKIPVDLKANVRVQVVTNETSLAGLDVGDLFLTSVDAGTDTIKSALENLPRDVADQVCHILRLSLLFLSVLKS